VKYYWRQQFSRKKAQKAQKAQDWKQF